MTLSELRFLLHFAAAVGFFFAASATFHVAQAADTCPGQDVATHQGVDAFNTLIDGQPGTPRLPQLNVVPSYNFEENKFVNQSSLSVVPALSGFWCQAQFEFFTPVAKALDRAQLPRVCARRSASCGQLCGHPSHMLEKMLPMMGSRDRFGP